MSTVTERLAAMGQEALDGALIALDAMSHPLTPREIERALREHGVPKSRAVLIAASVKRLNIIAVAGPERPAPTERRPIEVKRRVITRTNGNG
jgi:hypothetical protein